VASIWGADTPVGKRRGLVDFAHSHSRSYSARPGGFECRIAGLQVRLDSPLALPSGRSPPVPPEKHFEQIANPSLLCLLREGMTQR